MDFGKIENIIFVAVAAALGLFFLVTFFVVVSKGKRKCAAPDIALRIFASIVMLVCAVLFVGAVFTGLTGTTRIDAAANPAVLYLGGKATELPMPELFVMLAQNAVREIITVEFIVAFIALSADCLIANKKGKKPAKAKTAEEQKRDAELEKIRRLGDSAVKKSSVAAGSDGGATAAEAEKPEEKAEEPEEPQEDFDWRVDREPEKKQAEFVGLSHEDSASDDFDTFDDLAEEPQAGDADGDFSETESDEEPSDGDGQAAEDSFDAQEEQSETEEEEIETAQADTPSESDYAQSESDDVPWYARGGEAAVDEEPETEEEEPETAGDNGADFDSGDNFGEAPPRDSGADYGAGAESYDDVEPDRGIYIPPIRTVTRAPRTASRPSAAKKPTAKSSGGARKSAAKKSGGVSADGGRKPEASTRAKKQGGSGAGKRAPAKKSDDSKKLPVTRRYVILDRTSAVNIFSDYLKERDGADKDKLKSSINTIIIK